MFRCVLKKAPIGVYLFLKQGLMVNLIFFHFLILSHRYVEIMSATNEILFTLAFGVSG